MIKTLLAILLMLGATDSIVSQTTKTFKGTVDYKFLLSSTNSIKPAKRLSFERELDPYFKKLNLLILYYQALNSGDINAAEKILIADTGLRKKILLRWLICFHSLV